MEPAVDTPAEDEASLCSLVPADAESVEVAPFVVESDFAFAPDVAPAVSFTDERSMLSPNHFDWITSITPFEVSEEIAPATAVLSSELPSSTPTQ